MYRCLPAPPYLLPTPTIMNKVLPVIKKVSLNTAIFCGLLALAPTIQANSFTITTIDCPNGLYTAPASINASGQVVGDCDDNVGWHAFVTNGAAITPFDGGTPNYVTAATGINAGGTVAGTYNDGVNRPQGLVYSNGVTSLFNILDSTNVPANLLNPRSINAGGKVVGEFLDVILPRPGFIAALSTTPPPKPTPSLTP